MRIAVIGAGPAGLSSMRHIKKDLPDAVVVGFDANDDVGGNWIYTERVNTGQSTLLETTNIYKTLRTNLPKQIMGLNDYPMPASYSTFLHNKEFLEYLQNYAQHFDLKKYFKLKHMVTAIKRFENNWKVSYKNLLTDQISEEDFDYVFICSGRYSRSKVPNFEGSQTFQGRQMHSRYYKIPDSYKGKNVMVVGSGSSGMQISTEIATVADKVYLSHHRDHIPGKFPDNYIMKPDVKKLSQRSVEFIDGTLEDIDDIVYCTGYELYYPFLDPNCGITIESNVMRPLYRQIVNIEQPSMFFIGMTIICSAIPIRELQAKYCVALVGGKFELPSKEDMMKFLYTEYQKTGHSVHEGLKVTHALGDYEPDYTKGLAEEAKIKPMPYVYYLIRKKTAENRIDFLTYTSYEYEIIDDDNFVLRYLPNVGN